MKTNKCSGLAGAKIFAEKIVVFLVILFVFAFIGLNTFREDTYAYSASLTTSGTVTVDVSAAGNGANIGVDNVVVNSTCPNGYTLSIAGGDDNKLYKGGDSTSSSYISPTTGTKESPKSIIVTLSNPTYDALTM